MGCRLFASVEFRVLRCARACNKVVVKKKRELFLAYEEMSMLKRRNILIIHSWLNLAITEGQKGDVGVGGG